MDNNTYSIKEIITNVPIKEETKKGNDIEMKKDKTLELNKDMIKEVVKEIWKKQKYQDVGNIQKIVRDATKKIK